MRTFIITIASFTTTALLLAGSQAALAGHLFA
jgi:hypothetical protein